MLPRVLFEPDGTGLTAVHPTKDIALWNLQMFTIMASVFGLDGKSWKPLTVLEDDEEDVVSDERQPSITGSMATVDYW
jgi:hypothetical protein